MSESDGLIYAVRLDGPTGPGELLAALCERLLVRMGGVLQELDDEVDALEEEVLRAESQELRPKRAGLREVADHSARYVEDLDSARDRAAVTQEELNSRLSEAMNQKMYVVALVAAIFLPLGLPTGLLGINVGAFPARRTGSALPWCASCSSRWPASRSGPCAAAAGCEATPSTLAASRSFPIQTAHAARLTRWTHRALPW